MKNKNENLRFYIIISFCLLLFFIYIGYRIYKRQELYSKFIVTTGKVYNVTGFWKGSRTVEYKFYINGKVNYSSSVFILNEKGISKVINETFPVVYSPTDFTECEILLCPCDFEKYNIEFPEDLSWIREYCLK